MAPNYDTRYTLIGKALDLNNQEAWAELHAYYSKLIYHLLTNLSVPAGAKDEVHQLVMIKLASSLKHYSPEKGKFRTWFSTLIKNELFTFYRKQKNFVNSMRPLDDHTLENLPLDESDYDLRVDEEWTRYIMQIAMERLQLKFRGNAIKIFELGCQGLSTDEICEKLNLSSSTVYTLRKRVKRYLCNEAESIIADTEFQSSHG